MLFTVNMGREIWDLVYCVLNKGCLLNRGAFYSKHGKRNLIGLCLIELLFTVNMGREIWDFLYSLLNKGAWFTKVLFTVNMLWEEKFRTCLVWAIFFFSFNPFPPMLSIATDETKPVL